MRTTVTLDDDVSVMLERLRKKRGLTFEEALNLALRQGLYQLSQPPEQKPYKLATFSLGKSYLDLDDIGEALAVAEGESYR